MPTDVVWDVAGRRIVIGSWSERAELLEGATLLVCLAATTESALGALKQVQARRGDHFMNHWAG